MSWSHACCQYGTLANTSLHVIHNADKSETAVHQHHIPLIISSRLLAKVLLNNAVIYTAVASASNVETRGNNGRLA